MFEIGSTLTTASASSVVLVNGANPCNVYWQVGSSATLGTTTAFQGNLMALASISLNNGATVIGRVLARNGAVTLINNVLDSSRCAAGISSGPRHPVPTAPKHRHRHGARSAERRRAGQPGEQPARDHDPQRHDELPATPHATCTSGFRATVHGKLIKRVVFSLDGKRISRQTASAPSVSSSRPARCAFRHGPRHLQGRDEAEDARARLPRLRGRRPHPTTGPSQFTG